MQNSAKHSAIFYKIADQRNNYSRVYLLELFNLLLWTAFSRLVSAKCPRQL